MLTNLQVVLLNILKRTQQQTGYDLKKSLDNNAAWCASHQQVYRELASAEKGGVVSFITEDQTDIGKPNKKIYTLTKQGEKELSDTIDSADIKLLKFNDQANAFLYARNADYYTRFLEEVCKKIDKLTTSKNELELRNDPSEWEQLQAVERQIAHYSVDKTWCEGVIEKLNSLN